MIHDKAESEMVRYIVICDGDVTFLKGSVSQGTLDRFYQFCSEEYGYSEVFYYDYVTKVITVIKGEVSLRQFRESTSTTPSISSTDSWGKLPIA